MEQERVIGDQEVEWGGLERCHHLFGDLVTDPDPLDLGPGIPELQPDRVPRSGSPRIDVDCELGDDIGNGGHAPMLEGLA